MPSLPEWLECKGLPVKICNGYRVRHGLTPLPQPERHNVPKPPADHQKKPRPTAWASRDCVHRGEVVRHDTANLCGVRGQSVAIHACAVHGECSLRRYCQHQRVKTCTTCRDCTPPEEISDAKTA